MKHRFLKLFVRGVEWMGTVDHDQLLLIITFLILLFCYVL